MVIWKNITLLTGQRVGDCWRNVLRFAPNKYVEDENYVILTNADNYYISRFSSRSPRNCEAVKKPNLYILIVFTITHINHHSAMGI